MFYHQWNFLIGYATHSLFCDRKYQAFSVRFLTKWQLLLRIFRAVWKGFRSSEQLVDLYLKQLDCLLLIMHDSWPPQLSHDKYCLIETLVKVWESLKSHGNTRLRLMFLQDFSFFQTSTCVSIYNSIGTQYMFSTCTCIS